MPLYIWVEQVEEKYTTKQFEHLTEKYYIFTLFVVNKHTM